MLHEQRFFFLASKAIVFALSRVYGRSLFTGYLTNVINPTVGLRAHHASNDFSLFNVKNTAQTLSEYRFNDCDHVPIGCVRRPSLTVIEPALHGPQDRDCAPVPSGALEETHVGWIQSLLYPSSMMIGQ